SDGDWIEVKKQLTVGEERAAMQAVVGEVKADGSRKPNLEMMGLAELHAYLVEWSFRDAKDKPVPVTLGAIRNLDVDTYREMEAALEQHIKAMEAEAADRKNAQR